MTAMQLVRETLMAYIKWPTKLRGKQLGICRYITDDGRKCAVGRCMLNPREHACAATVTSLSYRYNFDDLLKPEYRGFPIQLWEELQTFHDYDGNWTNKGLSARGDRTLAELEKGAAAYDRKRAN